LTLIGYPSGTPAKIAEGAHVIDARANLLDYFDATTDSFEGNSGSGVFDDSARLVGILVRGSQDYVDRGNCQVVNRLPEDGSQGAESCSYVARALAELCAGAAPNARICGGGLDGGVPRCGDGVCTVPETPQTCPQDCPAPQCGNGICEPGEETTCQNDCGGGGGGRRDGGGGGRRDGGTRPDGGYRQDGGAPDGGLPDAGADAGSDAGVIERDGGGSPVVADAGLAPAPKSGGGCATTGSNAPLGPPLLGLLALLWATRKRRSR
jgi:hypothetical protein